MEKRAVLVNRPVRDIPCPFCSLLPRLNPSSPRSVLVGFVPLSGVGAASERRVCHLVTGITKKGQDSVSKGSEHVMLRGRTPPSHVLPVLARALLWLLYIEEPCLLELQSRAS